MKMNLPNKITVLRLVMTVIFVALGAVPKTAEIQGPNIVFWKVCYVLAVFAGITDFLDGYLARKYNLITDFGKLMDPLADKVHTLCSFVLLSAYGFVPFWVTCILLTREFAVNGLRTLAAKQGQVIAARNIGKLKTVLQMFILAFVGYFWAWDINVKEGAQPAMYWTIQGLLWAISLLTVYSGIEYYWKGRHLYMHDA